MIHFYSPGLLTILFKSMAIIDSDNDENCIANTDTHKSIADSDSDIAI